MRKINENRVNEIVNQVIREMTEKQNNVIPKSAFRAVEKLNGSLNLLQQLTGDEYPELLDTSTGTESFFYITSPVVIKKGQLMWTEQDSYSEKPSNESWNLIGTDDITGDLYFREREFKDQISYLNSCIRKATKYYKEYNPDWDDDEKQRDNFLGQL